MAEGSRGLFDLAGPVLDRIAPLLGWLPGLVQLAVWALLAAAVSMGLYGLTSRQGELTELKPRIAAAQRALIDYDGPMAGLWTLMGRQFRLIGRQLWLTFWPAVLGSIPILFLLVWLSNHYGHVLPRPGEPVEVTAEAAPGTDLPALRWEGAPVQAGPAPGAWQVPWPSAAARARLVDADGAPLLTLPTRTATPIVHRRRWWNVLIGNPAGYLPDSGPVEAVSIGLPAQAFLPFGPGWLRGWLVPFFTLLVVFSLGIKRYWRLR